MHDTARTSGQKRPAPQGQRLVTPQTASAETGIAYTTLRDLHFNGHLPIVKLPGCRRWFIRREDLDGLIARSVETGTASA